MSQNLLTLLTNAAEMRTAGMSWASVSQRVHRKPSTCSKWPSRYKREWNRVYLQAQRQRYEDVSNESLTYLRSLLRSDEQKIQLKSIELVMKHAPAAIAAIAEASGDKAEDQADYEEFLREKEYEASWRKKIDRVREL